MLEMPTASEKVEELARELERALIIIKLTEMEELARELERTLIIIKLTEMLEDNKTLSKAIEELKKH